ncbi:MAG: phosphohistidine phosphatase SixA [Rhodospirillaceae bacterium]|mgnify:CR=1 FL=1|jgi:phosphohistidine phosphatase|nr:phosphohistidine phosphatase SixA [Rhodospirillaceae bacterium]|tara:strand:- start:4473 stop:4943 length:471 start_codon:yes stop_codon:yes gene_type:complete
MHIYLVQHGAAVPKDENPEKPLSDGGRDEVKKMASFLARSRVSAARVIHSGKLRALETALLLAEVLGPGNAVEEAGTGLAPNDPTDELFAAIDDWTEDTIVVGHLPLMSKMVSRLVTGDEDETVVHFRPGSVACLERGENGGGWTVAWFLRPELLG